MKFTLSTKPFSDALNLSVVNGNISKFYLKSCLAQLTATKRTLTINLEAASIATEVILRGSGDEDESSTVFVDCSLLKQLVSTFESSTTTIEFIEGGIVLHSGSSKFNLSAMIDSKDMSLRSPALADSTSPSVGIDKTGWKFISDYQMYAIAMSFVYPVYTRVWIGEDGQVVVGDFGQQIFTASKKGVLGTTCLVSDTIVNLFNSLPDNAILTRIDKSYRIDVKTDGFEYASEFTPQYEGDDGVGNYKSSVILSTMTPDKANCFKIAVPVLTKCLNQSDLLSGSSEDKISMSLSASNEFELKDENVECKVQVEGTCKPFSVLFKTGLLKSLVSNLDSENVSISPVMDEGNAAAGIVVWTDDLTAMLGGTD